MHKQVLLAIITTLLISGCQSTPTDTITISDGEYEVMLIVEIADEPKEQAQGLMGRERLAEDTGMLFMYDEERPRAFWMKDTTIPLSIAYIDSEGTIISIHDLEPLDETPVRSSAPAQYALEVNKGFFESHRITAGDKVMIP